MSGPSPTRRRGRLRIEGFDTSETEAACEGIASTNGPEAPTGESAHESGHPQHAAPVHDPLRPGRDHGTNGLHHRSRLEDVLERLRRNRSAIVGGSLLVAFTLVAVFARPIEVTALGYRIALQPIGLAPYDPTAMYVGPTNAGPSLAHPFGTDWAGRDVFSRVLVGGRYSLAIGGLAVALACAIGIPLGTISGYVGGRVDELFMRVVDTLFAFPFLVLAIAIVAVLGQGVWNVVLALVLTGWLSYARLVRGEVLSIRESTHVTASRALGTPTRTIIWRHVLPGALAPVIVQAALNVGTVVLAAAALGFLGLGLPPGSAEWGTMLAEGYHALLQGHWHLTVFPGLALFGLVLAITLLGDGLNDALDPRTDSFERERRGR